MKPVLLAVFLVFVNMELEAAPPAGLAIRGPADERLIKSAAALRAFRTSASGPAKTLLDQALCIGVAPRHESGQWAVDMKGFVSCRNSASGTWSNPAAFIVEGGGTFWPVIGASIDLILVASNPSTASRFGDREAMLGSPKLATIPGPLRQDQVPLQNIYPVVLAYSQSTAGIEGINLSGGNLREDRENNSFLYREELSNASIFRRESANQNSPAVDLFLTALQSSGPEASGK